MAAIPEWPCTCLPWPGDGPCAGCRRNIVAILNQKHGTTLPVEVVEGAVTAGLTSWEALRCDADAPRTFDRSFARPKR